ncbi:Retroviral aspartyl protease, partial [Pristimantis euphronides]
MIHLRTVLLKLRHNALFAKLEKCTFGVQSTSFLGHIIMPHSIVMDPVKVKAITDWVQPTTLKALQRFLGFANYYRRFIRNFSVIAKPLTDLTWKGASLSSWGKEATKAFLLLKESFITAPVLVQADQTRPFVVEVDASEVGVEAVLSQGTAS